MKKISKPKKTIEPIDTSPCMCRVHFEADKSRKDAIPCVGHGAGCPCTAEMKRLEELAKEQKANEPEQVAIKEQTNEGTKEQP